jgi:hypothetical protein
MYFKSWFFDILICSSFIIETQQITIISFFFSGMLVNGEETLKSRHSLTSTYYTWTFNLSLATFKLYNVLSCPVNYFISIVNKRGFLWLKMLQLINQEIQCKTCLLCADVHRLAWLHGKVVVTASILGRG